MTARRLHRRTLVKALTHKGIIPRDEASQRIVMNQLRDPKVYRAVEGYVKSARGAKHMSSFRKWIIWVWNHQEILLQLLGLTVTLLAEDGTVKEIARVEDAPAPKPEKKEVTVETVHGVKDGVEVSNFITPELEIDLEIQPSQEDGESSDGSESDELYEMGGEEGNDAPSVQGPDIF